MTDTSSAVTNPAGQGIALASLLTQNEAWRKSQTAEVLESLAAGQASAPKFMWLGCSDSRVDPEIVMASSLGDIFVHRNIANQTDDTSVHASLEYAVKHLGVTDGRVADGPELTLMLVVRHTDCGGCKAPLAASAPTSDDSSASASDPVAAFLQPLIKLHRTFSADPTLDDLIRANVAAGVDNVISTPAVKQAWTQGKSLAVHGLLKTSIGISLALRGVHRPPLLASASLARRSLTGPARPPRSPARSPSPSTRARPVDRLHAPERHLHTSASTNAAVAELTDAEAREVFGTAWGRPRAGSNFGVDALRSRSIAAGPSTPRMRSVPSDSYVPSDADFAAVDLAEEDVADGSFATPLSSLSSPPAPRLDAKPPRRRRRRAVAALPPLEGASAELPDGQTRFDWRARALSRVRRQAGPRWFEPFRRREEPRAPAEPTSDSGIKMRDAIERYRNHFKPLLLAELDEVRREFEERLYQWSETKMESDGYMRDQLAAALGPPPKAGEGHTVTFTYTGKGASRDDFDRHRLVVGANVVLSKTHPLLDPVLDTCEILQRTSIPTRQEGTEPELIPRLVGRVQYVGRGTMRVAYEVPRFIDFKAESSGRPQSWRLDLAYDTLVFERQFDALEALAHDPVALDAAGYPPVPKHDGDDVDAALLRQLRARKPGAEHILLGTALRDVLLRRFQADFEPGAIVDTPTPAVAPALPSPTADVADMRPTDVEATASPRHLERDARDALAKNQLIQSWARRHAVPQGTEPIVVEGDPVVPLNASQKRAIAMMLSERLSLVQGPPGTGKTRVIIETIKLLKQHWQIPHPILVCAHTNVAVDNLLEGFAAHGLVPVRYGASDRVRDDLAQYTLDERVRQHPLGPDIARLEEARKALSATLTYADWKGNTGDAQKEATKARIKELRSELYKKKGIAHQEVLAAADVSFIDFPFVFLDEASMATEPLSLVPLTRGSAQVAILGDHKQLPPVITSDVAQAGGLAISMFERLMHEHHVPSIMLDTQYRMHPTISAFSSAAFYNSDLKDGTVVDGRVRPGLDAPDTSFLALADDGAPLNVTLIDHDHAETAVHRSVANPYEARRVCDIVFDLLYRNPDLRGADIGVIAPYVAQIRQITDYLHHDAGRAARFADVLGPARAREIADVEVRTVDGFEGREKAVIVFSCTRANAGGYIGFLADWRRLNVGLTRAKRALILIGSRRTLARARTGQRTNDALPAGGAAVWRAFIRHLDERGMVLRDEVYDDDVDDNLDPDVGAAADATAVEDRAVGTVAEVGAADSMAEVGGEAVESPVTDRAAEEVVAERTSVGMPDATRQALQDAFATGHAARNLGDDEREAWATVDDVDWGEVESAERRATG
ncbi:hypothetical protein Q5752_003756 [Cryptotrichosporon argae]